MNADNPLLFFRIGWMAEYAGHGDISGGGSYVKERGEGGEIWNFKPEKGVCYGYVRSNNGAGIDLKRISPSHSWKKGDELRGVDIVFIAKRPTGDQFVVGWYKNATVIHKHHKQDEFRANEKDYGGHVCWTKEGDAILLPEKERDLEVWHANKKKGFIGQSNVWYADGKNASESEIEQISEFKSKLRSYIDARAYINAPKTLDSRIRKKQIDTDEIFRIDKSAVSTVWKFYENDGYTIRSVEHFALGWDLEAVKANEKLFIEVKGHKGGEFHFELSANEYRKLKEHHKQYKVCGVLRALTEPELTVFAPVRRDAKWVLTPENGKYREIELEEKISAKASPVSKST